ncbi:phosphatidylserine synthase [Pseudalgibacter alginicilyticus]|uniref:Phosphatidylserine synthase n=1 Tax=Pseudalgibacter alginicilyticus TaxID=1736674 RepID=A0A0P0D781_9FLAO|nr:CDP-alcohol phosphatidyltransferase family protein [Pseudalgibacter alginicilyticus]ALJ04572.1 phosphatidylserine synthase [Pseudalgibacter alginicilyticus]
MKQHIPNAITLLNLLCGSIAAIFAVEGFFVYAAFFVFLGIFFDFFDGFFARKLKVQSELGLQLDSLADMVTSGLVPGIIMYKLLGLTLNTSEINNDWGVGSFESNISILPFVGLLITLGSAYRLAKFNIDEEQQNYFKGLPTPANALLILSLPLIMEFQNSDAMNVIILNKWFLIALTIFSCYILNSNIKLFALKFKDYSFKGNASRYIFMMLSFITIVVLQFAAIPFVIILYIFMSVLDNLTTK